MADTNPSANMGLPIPSVGGDPGPDYAKNVNSSLTIIDGHDHSVGNGVPVTPAGLNISTDLSFSQNNATLLRSVRFTPQVNPLSDPADLGCIYVSGVDLYFNDVDGNQVRITQTGGVAGSPGSIANLTSPASASYVGADETFVWQSDASTPANMDGGSVILRNIVANSHGLTLSPPASLAADFTITLPTLPPGQQIMTLDNSGNMGAPYTVDGSTIAIASNVIGVPASGITSVQLSANSVTSAKIVAGAVLTAAIGSLQVTTPKIALLAVGLAQTAAPNEVFSLIISDTTTSGAPAQPSNATVTFTTTGRNVRVELMAFPATLANPSFIGVLSGGVTTTTSPILFIDLLRDGTVIAQYEIGLNGPISGGPLSSVFPPGSINFIDRAPAAGSHTYSLTWFIQGTGVTGYMQCSQLHAQEY